MRVLVAHPGKQHSYQMASALENLGLLGLYCTTVYDKPGTILNKVKGAFGSADAMRASARRCEGIPDERVGVFCQISGLVYLLIIKTGNARLKRTFQRWKRNRFGKKVAKLAAKRNVDAVIMFDKTAFSCFEELEKHAPHIVRILDMTASTRAYVKHVFEEEPDAESRESLKKAFPYLWDEGVMGEYAQEVALAHYYLAASEVAKRSLLYSGVSEEAVFLAPYGAPRLEGGSLRAAVSDGDERLKLVYVGNVDYQKGIHYLLKALDSVDRSKYALDVYGSYRTGTSLYKRLVDNPCITIHGPIPHKDIGRAYQAGDVFVFPSLNDGYGLVVLEALSFGLPVVCSRNAGACGLIEDGVNGYTYDVGDVERLAKIINHLADHKDEVLSMRPHALERVSSCTWSAYQDSLASLMSKIEDELFAPRDKM